MAGQQLGGPHITAQGDVISSVLSTVLPQAAHFLFGDTRLMLGQIQKIYAIDDKNNNGDSPAYFTVYDVKVFHPDGGSEVVNRCRAMQPFFGGGFNNFFEVLPVDPGPKAEDFSISRSLKRGSWVLVGMIDGQRANGVILGAMPHPNKVAVKTRPKKSKGTYLEGEFQGLNFKITNEGALQITMTGPKDDDGKLVDEKIGPTQIIIDKKGVFTVSTNEKQSWVIDRTKKTITVKNGDSSYTMAQDGNKVSQKSDTYQIDTNKDLIGNIGGKLTLEVSDTTTINAPTINLGDDSPTHKAALDDRVEKRLSAIESKLNAFILVFKTHIHNALGPVSPTSPSPQAAAIQSLTPDPSPIGSSKVKIAT